jgi:predicted nucleic acid-binding protein
VKVAIDTSVIVPILLTDHLHHLRAIWWVDEARDFDRCASWHAYAESWAVLTAMPIDPRVTGEVARAALERLRTRIDFVPPRAKVYSAAVQRCAQRGVRSGAIYDALHLVSAEAEAADVLLTFNERDFKRLANPTGPRIVVPPDPPGAR